MAAALLHQMEVEFVAMAKGVGTQVVASLAQWREDTAIEMDEQFQVNLDQLKAWWRHVIALEQLCRPHLRRPMPQ